MENRNIINDASLAPKERLAALRALLDSGVEFPPLTVESNNHIHTMYSFSPYTPASAALRSREAGLSVAGSVDHDSYEAAAEMRDACAILGLDCVTGFELRVLMNAFAGIKINNPDSLGIAYMTVQAVPKKAAVAVREFLAPVCQARGKRNERMIAALNSLLGKADIAPLDYQKDIVPLSQAAKGGSVTERHLFYALALRLIERFGKADGKILDMLDTRFGIKASKKITEWLCDVTNPYYEYDLLGLLKSDFSPKIFIQPDASECPTAETVCAFAQSIGAVAAYAYLGDVAGSPTGDKKDERFEDSYLDKLFPALKEMGYTGVAYMPPRNTKEQLRRVHEYCKQYGLMEISGVDINSPRQSFNCPELLDSEFEHLRESTKQLARMEAEADGG